MIQWELQQLGLQWSNIGTAPVESDHLSVLTICYIMAFDALLYFVITWYIEGVFPGRYGVGKPWYFPVMPSYWCGQRAELTGLAGKSKIKHVILQEEENKMTGEKHLISRGVKV